MFGQNTCIGEKLKHLKAQLDHELGDHFNFEQLYGWNEFKNYLKASDAMP